MNSPKKYIAIVSPDRSGPAYGVGETEADARQDAAQWGFESTDGVAVEITDEAAAAVAAGNPDAWSAAE